jgi:hypothetical protein
MKLPGTGQRCINFINPDTLCYREFVQLIIFIELTLIKI